MNAEVQLRLEQAEHVLADLALTGTPEHTTISARRRSGTEDVVLTLQAITRQARLSTAAAERAEQEAGWLQHTAAEWQRYLRWLVRRQRDLAPRLDGMGEDDRQETALAWSVTTRECEAARRRWGTIAGRAEQAGAALAPSTAVPAARLPLADRLPEPPVSTGPDAEPAGATARHELDTVVLDGHVYVRVDDLAGSLRGRADAFSDAADAAAAAHDELGVLVSEVVAAELSSRADALDVAGIELATTVLAPPPDEQPGPPAAT